MKNDEGFDPRGKKLGKKQEAKKMGPPIAFGMS
jgi:hypothetical protein